MWSPRKRLNLEDIGGPTAIDVLARVASPNDVVSPITGARGACIRVEVFERRDPSAPVRPDELLGTVVLGDLVSVSIDLEGHEVTTTSVDVVVRRAELRFTSPATSPEVLEMAAPELVPILRTQRGGGVIFYAERRIRCGEDLRLRAVVERGASADRRERGARLILRDDLAPVVLDEVLPAG